MDMPAAPQIVQNPETAAVLLQPGQIVKWFAPEARVDGDISSPVSSVDCVEVAA